jgi:class 3 adenylate cyclase
VDRIRTNPSASRGSPPSIPPGSGPTTKGALAAEERDRARWDDVCHDLRTPLSIILGYSEMLLEDTEALPAWNARAVDMRRVREAGQRMLVILDEARSASRRETGAESFVVASARMHRDLRAPVDVVKRAMERVLAETQAATEDDALIVDLERIRTAGRRFDALIDELLPLAGVEAPASAETTPRPVPKPSWLPPPPAMPDLTRGVTVPPPGSTRAVIGNLLVVDDNEANRAVLSKRLSRQGHKVSAAAGGREALELLGRERFDLVLLDVMMPDMDGYQVLEQMKSDEVLRHLPVVMISARGDLEGMVRCLELGAEDYLAKPFNPVLLRARIGASLAQKQQRDRERFYVERLRAAQEQSEALLLNVLPKAIADRLKLGESAIADYFPAVTVLFADLVGFTAYAARLAPATVVERLNEIFSAFDQLAERHGVEKIKTIGDAYLAVGGLPVARPDHADAIAELALDMQVEVERFNQRTGESIVIRTGIHSGPVVAGIIGTTKFSYDLWGDTVNTASRMESHGVPGAIQISEATRVLLSDRYVVKPRGAIEIKSKGLMETALLTGRR